MTDKQFDNMLVALAVLAGAFVTLAMWGLFLYWAWHGKEVAAALLACAIAIEDSGRRRARKAVAS